MGEVKGKGVVSIDAASRVGGDDVISSINKEVRTGRTARLEKIDEDAGVLSAVSALTES